MASSSRREDPEPLGFRPCREPPPDQAGLSEGILRPLQTSDAKARNIVNGRTSVSAKMALRLGAAFRMSPEFWLNAQKAVDLFRAERSLSTLPSPVLKAS